MQSTPESPALPAARPATAEMTARLSRHTLLLLASNLGGALLLFALSVLIGRTLGRDGLGVYSVVLAWVFPLSLLGDFGLSTLATREIARNPADAGRQLALMAWARLLLGGLAALALAAGAPLLSDDPTVIAGLRVSALMVVLLPFYSSFTAAFKGMGAMWPIPWLNIGMLAAQVALSLVVLALGGDVVALLVVNTVTSLAQLAAAWLLWRSSFAPRTTTAPGQRLDRAELAATLRRAWPFALAAVFAALQMRLSLILLERFAGVDDVALFAAASRFVEAARLLPNAFFGALFPALAVLATDPRRSAATFRRALQLLGLFGLAGIAGAALLAAPVIRLTYGDDFVAAAPALQVLALGLLFSLLRGAYTLALYARQAEGRVNVVNGAVLALQIPLSLWLIHAQGALGAAYALALTEAVALVWLWREQRTMGVMVPAHDKS